MHGEDIKARMVRSGWALSYRQYSRDYDPTGDPVMGANPTEPIVLVAVEDLDGGGVVADGSSLFSTSDKPGR